MRDLCHALAKTMTTDFYNHFVNDTTLVVVFRGCHFALDRRDKASCQAMVEYGKTVRGRA